MELRLDADWRMAWELSFFSSEMGVGFLADDSLGAGAIEADTSADGLLFFFFFLLDEAFLAGSVVV
jgi:hypothetical protein